jgi:hypothetical protein
MLSQNNTLHIIIIIIIIIMYNNTKISTRTKTRIEIPNIEILKSITVSIAQLVTFIHPQVVTPDKK